MNFFLPFKHEPGSFKISLGHSFLSIGSCFSTHLASYLKDFKFKVLDNPLGIRYNPLSIIETLQNALDNTIEESCIIERDGLFYYYQAHSSIVAESKKELLNILEIKNKDIKSALATLDHLVITWGTAWAFTHIKLDKCIANCHKMPEELFKRTLIESQRIILAMETFLENLLAINPNLKITLTVSPVRHTKLGLSNNIIGKAELVKASLLLSKDSKNIHYFESYELVIDVLRDYRFYESDLIHPNQQAIDFVLGNFNDVFFDKKTHSFVKEWREITTSLRHKAFNPLSVKHQLFLVKLRERLISVNSKVNIQEELQQIDGLIQ
jgi:hypothetical protein